MGISEGAQASTSSFPPHFTAGLQEEEISLILCWRVPSHVLAFTPTEKDCRSVAQSCVTLCDPMDCSPPGSSVHGDSPGKNTGVGCHALLQGIFPTQGSNPGLLHCRRILYRMHHQGRERTTGPQSVVD